MKRSTKVISLLACFLVIFLFMLISFYNANVAQVEVSLKSQSDVAREQTMQTQAFKSYALQQYDSIVELERTINHNDSAHAQEIGRERAQRIKNEVALKVLQKRFDSLLRTRPKYNVSDVKPIN